MYAGRFAHSLFKFLISRILTAFAVLLIGTNVLFAGPSASLTRNTSLPPCSLTFQALAHTYPESHCGYQSGHCSSNVFPLLSAMKHLGLDEKKANVLYIYPNRIFDELQPQMGRGSDKRWRFHVVVEYEGEILDLDYAKQTPSVIATYFQDMFGSGNVDFKHLKVKEITPERYRSVLRDKGGFHYVYHLNESEERYPVEDLSTYLARKSPDRKVEQTDVRPSRTKNPYKVINYVAALQKNNIQEFNRVGIGRPVKFMYSTDPDDPEAQAWLVGQIESIGGKMVRIKGPAGSIEIPLELVWADSVQPASRTDLKAPRP